MFHVREFASSDTNGLYTECKRNILSRMPDAGNILQFLAAQDITVSFVVPAGLSQAFGKSADAGSLSILDKHIYLDRRKTVEQLADDLARRTRVLMQAPQPNGVERFLHDCMGVTFGRFMKLEQKNGPNI